MRDSMLIRRLVQLAIEEDLAYGDITSELIISDDAVGRAVIIAKEPCVVCGLDLIPVILQELGAVSETEFLTADGTEVEAGTELVHINGELRELLSAERTILNFLQRCSGVATHTRKFALEAAGVVVLDTRKTIPGWRVLDKYSVRIGGGRNHRAHLGDMILVKNNHIDAARGATLQEKIRNAMISLIDRKPYYMPVEVEVRNVEELKLVLPFNPDVVMLDNFKDEDIEKAFQWMKTQSYRVQVEVSGNMTAERISRLKVFGVSCISAGTLTTEARNVDISMRVS